MVVGGLDPHGGGMVINLLILITCMYVYIIYIRIYIINIYICIYNIIYI